MTTTNTDSPPPAVYAAYWALPGSLPDIPAAEFDSFGGALAYLTAEIDARLFEWTGGHDDGEGHEELIEDADEAKHDLEEIGIAVFDGYEFVIDTLFWRAAKGDTMKNLLNTLYAIQQHDPDGWDIEPAEADYAAFEEWVRAAHGDRVWERYIAAGWGECSEV